MRDLIAFVVFSIAAMCIGGSAQSKADELPAPDKLPEVELLPDPLVMLDGTKVSSKEQWDKQRRAELKRLFEHYMYGVAPPAPDKIDFKVERVDEKFFGGKATKKEVVIRFGPEGTPPINLLLVVPNKRQGPAPVFLGLNFCGNHTLLKDDSIALPTVWMPGRCPGVKDNKATAAGRGARLENFSMEYVIGRGYASATFYHGDVDPDKPDFADGVHPHYRKKGQEKQSPTDWAAIRAWAWGLSRAIDYLEQDDDINNERICVYGHSRNGKTALVCGAFDERVDLVVPHQAGCGGTSPSRSPVGEQVRQINDRFPHWFCGNFHQFNEQVARLPFDQHSLIALCAPRPVLLTNAVKDQWADPSGQFDALKAADPVYRLLGADGLKAESMPPLGKLVDSNLGYYIREGGHSATEGDWKVFLDFADKRFEKK